MRWKTCICPIIFSSPRRSKQSLRAITGTRAWYFNRSRTPRHEERNRLFCIADFWKSLNLFTWDGIARLPQPCPKLYAVYKPSFERVLPLSVTALHRPVREVLLRTSSVLSASGIVYRVRPLRPLRRRCIRSRPLFRVLHSTPPQNFDVFTS